MWHVGPICSGCLYFKRLLFQEKMCINLNTYVCNFPSSSALCRVYKNTENIIVLDVCVTIRQVRTI